MKNTRLYYKVWLPSFNTNGSLIVQSIGVHTLLINEPLINNDGYQTKLSSVIPVIYYKLFGAHFHSVNHLN